MKPLIAGLICIVVCLAVAFVPAPLVANPALEPAGPDRCEPESDSGDCSNPPDPKPPSLAPYKDKLTFPPPAKPVDVRGNVQYYRITMKRSSAKLHADLPPTDLFTYDGSYPGPTFDVKSSQKVVVEWVNDLSQPHPVTQAFVSASGSMLFPQDWPGTAGQTGTDNETSAYPSPLTTVVHLHGGTTPPGSDGYPDDAYPPGQSAIYNYPGEPRGALLWYHDHAMMITRLNVYAGLAGLYIVRDDAETALKLPRGEYELPLLIQDRNFALDKKNEKFTGGLLHKLVQKGAEFYGPYTLVNGVVWPYAEVEPRQLRLRLLNGSNGRFYRLRLRTDDQRDGAPKAAKPCYSTAEFTQIGVDGGLLDAPVAVPKAGLTLAPAERADVILDLRQHAGEWVALENDYPMPMVPPNDPPGLDNIPHAPIHPEVLLLKVGDKPVKDDFTLDPAKFAKSPRITPTADIPRRQICLIEDPPGSNNLKLNGRSWYDGIEEVVRLGGTEVWEFINTTKDVHPMHLHLVDFEVFEREPFDFKDGVDQGAATTLYKVWRDADALARFPYPYSPGLVLSGKPCKPDANEQGLKDTVRVAPMAVTRIVVKFGPFPGKYVYHCHVLEHEDMDMMRTYLIIPPGEWDTIGEHFPNPLPPDPAAAPGAGAAPRAVRGAGARGAMPKGAMRGHGK
jgi:spore coat protein A